MFTIVAYNDNAVAPQTDTDLPVVNDPSVTILNNHPIFPVPTWLQWVWAGGASLSRVRLSMPKWRYITRPVVEPVDQQAAPLSDNYRTMEYYRHGLSLHPIEELQVLRTNTGAGAERDYCVISVGDNNRNVPMGDMYSTRGTTAFTPTNNVWGSGALSLDDTLQVGRYSIIGLRVVNAGSVAGRLIFPGAPMSNAWPQIRPGIISSNGVNGGGLIWARYGIQGVYGEFESYALPQLEMLVNAAAANPECLLDIVNIRGPGVL